MIPKLNPKDTKSREGYPHKGSGTYHGPLVIKGSSSRDLKGDASVEWSRMQPEEQSGSSLASRRNKRLGDGKPHSFPQLPFLSFESRVVLHLLPIPT